MYKLLDNFLFLDGEQFLGVGAFATVYRVQHKIDQKLYALKVVDLDKIPS